MAAVGWLIVAPARLARGEGGDPTATQALVQQLEQDAAHRSAIAETLARAREALERARKLRATGDEAHAKTADGLARDWAEVAREVARAADAEEKAAQIRRKALDEQGQLERTRALVEEGIARIGRLRAELEAAGRGPGRDARKAVETHDGEDPKNPSRADAGVKPGPSGADSAHGAHGADAGGVP
jgi:hypothetical protein